MTSAKLTEKRLNLFSKVISIILMLFGAAAALTQILKISPLLESYPGWTWNWSNITVLIIGIILFLLGKGTTLKRFVRYSLFSGREKMKRLIFSVPFSAMLLIISAKVILGHNSHDYRMINSEGGLIEYGTSIAYILAFVFSVPVANDILKQERKIWGILYYIFAFGLIFVGLEEISWGQRLLGLESPDFFQIYNSQEEITIHNLEWFRHYLHNVYIIIGLIGSFSWLIVRQNRNKPYTRLVKYFIPTWFVSSFFLPPLIIFTILEYTNGFGFFVSKDQEGVELILSLGFLFLVVTNFFRQSLEWESVRVKVSDRKDDVCLN